MKAPRSFGAPLVRPTPAASEASSGAVAGPAAAAPPPARLVLPVGVAARAQRWRRPAPTRQARSSVPARIVFGPPRLAPLARRPARPRVCDFGISRVTLLQPRQLLFTSFDALERQVGTRHPEPRRLGLAVLRARSHSSRCGRHSTCRPARSRRSDSLSAQMARSKARRHRWAWLLAHIFAADLEKMSSKRRCHARLPRRRELHMPNPSPV